MMQNTVRAHESHSASLAVHVNVFTLIFRPNNFNKKVGTDIGDNVNYVR